jgi:hypothetical protein
VSEFIYQMEWECRHCHRVNQGLDGEDEGLRCRGCGSQRADEPWLEPRAGVDAARVTAPKLLERALQGEVWECVHCRHSERDEHQACSVCGAYRPEVSLRPAAFTLPPPHVPIPQPEPGFGQPKPNFYIWLGLALAAGFVVWLGAWLFGTHTSVGVVDTVSWERTAVIEERHIKDGSDWQGSMHAGAFDVSCVNKFRRYRDCNPHDCHPHKVSYTCNCTGGGSYACGSTRKCSSRKNGSGSCRDVTKYCTRPRRCDTCYRTKYDTCYDQCPVYDDWCQYKYPQWEEISRKQESGHDTKPHWPELEAHGADQRLQRAANYEVHIKDADHDWKYTPHTREEFQCFDVGTTHKVEYTRAGAFKVKD